MTASDRFLLGFLWVAWIGALIWDFWLLAWAIDNQQGWLGGVALGMFAVLLAVGGEGK